MAPEPHSPSLHPLLPPSLSPQVRVQGKLCLETSQASDKVWPGGKLLATQTPNPEALLMVFRETKGEKRLLAALHARRAGFQGGEWGSLAAAVQAKVKTAWHKGHMGHQILGNYSPWPAARASEVTPSARGHGSALGPATPGWLLGSKLSIQVPLPARLNSSKVSFLEFSPMPTVQSVLGLISSCEKPTVLKLIQPEPLPLWVNLLGPQFFLLCNGGSISSFRFPSSSSSVWIYRSKDLVQQQ